MGFPQMFSHNSAFVLSCRHLATAQRYKHLFWWWMPACGPHSRQVEMWKWWERVGSSIGGGEPAKMAQDLKVLAFWPADSSIAAAMLFFARLSADWLHNQRLIDRAWTAWIHSLARFETWMLNQCIRSYDFKHLHFNISERIFWMNSKQSNKFALTVHMG